MTVVQWVVMLPSMVLFSIGLALGVLLGALLDAVFVNDGSHL